MTMSRIGLYLAEAGFAGILFTVIGLATRALWDTRKGGGDAPHHS